MSIKVVFCNQKEDKKMSNIYFTITGLNHYYGNGRLSKER